MACGHGTYRVAREQASGVVQEPPGPFKTSLPGPSRGTRLNSSHKPEESASGHQQLRTGGLAVAFAEELLFWNTHGDENEVGGRRPNPLCDGSGGRVVK